MTRNTILSLKGFLLFLFLTSLLTFYSCKQPEQEPVFKERITYVSDGTIHVAGLKDNTYTEVGPGTEPALSFDGRYLAYVNNVGNKQRIAILDFPNRNTNIIEDVQGTSWNPVWSPTENRFLFSARVDFKGSSYQVAIVGHAREENKYVIAREGVNIISPSWAPDGESIYAHDTRFLYQFEKTGMLIGHAVMKEKFGSLHYNESTVVLPSPDGNRWLIGTGPEEPIGRPRKTSLTLFLFDELDKSTTRISPEELFISDFNWSSDSLGIIFSGKKTQGQRQTDIYNLSLSDGRFERLVKNATQPSCQDIRVMQANKQ
ncbi:MAG: hypothetical protein V2I46_14405 [Bacteroides sp.]|nr:hypothetical protein [Bacteroides sp.]